MWNTAALHVLFSFQLLKFYVSDLSSISSWSATQQTLAILQPLNTGFMLLQFVQFHFSQPNTPVVKITLQPK